MIPLYVPEPTRIGLSTQDAITNNSSAKNAEITYFMSVDFAVVQTATFKEQENFGDILDYSHPAIAYLTCLRGAQSDT